MSSEQSTTTIEAPRNEERPNKPDIPQATVPAAPETRGERFGRNARRTRLHLYAGLTVALLVCIVALVAANTRQVKLSWVVGSSTTSLVWIVLASAVLGWLLGIFTSALFRWRTRARRA
jgi:uncharacterized integral membrane protein